MAHGNGCCNVLLQEVLGDYKNVLEDIIAVVGFWLLGHCKLHNLHLKLVVIAVGPESLIAAASISWFTAYVVAAVENI